MSKRDCSTCMHVDKPESADPCARCIASWAAGDRWAAYVRDPLILADAPDKAGAVPAAPEPTLTRIDELAKAYAISYASPHHITFGVSGLRGLINELAAAPKAAPAEPVAYRYKDARGYWRYVGAPFTPGWDMPPNLVHEPLYATAPTVAPAEPTMLELAAGAFMPQVTGYSTPATGAAPMPVPAQTVTLTEAAPTVAQPLTADKVTLIGSQVVLARKEDGTDPTFVAAFASAIQEACAAAWGVKLGGGAV